MGIGSAESQSQFLLGRVVEEAYHLEGESADSTTRSMRHHVVPLTANDRIPEDVPSGSQFDGENANKINLQILILSLLIYSLVEQLPITHLIFQSVSF
jgi:hypothetical protein